ncbi:MAG: PilZ domain-containing protein [Candidatus Omnitrophica bacterium]|nr:PilZ domain-containing protein [Candidatus Omnitrophota bacterium]
MALKPKYKRQFSRIDLHAPLRYQVRGYAEFANAISDNVSLGGMAFNAHRFLAPETTIMLEVNLLSRILHPIARIKWCQPLPHSDRSRLGVEFLEFNQIEKNYLSDYIDMQQGVL